MLEIEKMDDRIYTEEQEKENQTKRERKKKQKNCSEEYGEKNITIDQSGRKGEEIPQKLSDITTVAIE